jgi:predicted acyl esterase
MPYAGIPGAALTAIDHVSKDTPPVSYTRWRGTVPGFDGMPFSVDVTVPCGGGLAMPTVVMAHGWTDDKTVWEETEKGDQSVSRDRPEQNSRWNNVWFVSRGYVVVNYTARGWHDSCGPDTVGATRLTPAPQCAGFEYWIHLNDKRWETRDAQWLAGALVQSGLADPKRLAITGGSNGGGPAASGALLANKVMCGAVPTPVALGPDPCMGQGNGNLVPWTTPDGGTPLTWAVAIPMYTYADLLQALTPNGRGSDGWAHAPADSSHSDPFGVPIAGTVAGLYAAGLISGFYSPPGIDPDADITVNSARLLAGNPFLQSDPLVARGVADQQFKSPISTPPQARVPIYWVQGFTDPLFTGNEALQILNMVRKWDPAYPIKVFLGDLGHDYTGQRQDEWDLAHAQMNDFIDHFLRPDRTPQAPAFDVGATVTRCLDHDAPMRYIVASTWADLHPEHITLVNKELGRTSSATVGPSGQATDPISTATLPLPGAYRGCRIMRPAATDPTVATSLFAVTKDLVLMGGPVVDITFSTTAADTQLHARLWDVAADGSAQGLVTRGTYRSLDAPGEGRRARFQLAPQGYRFPAGHRLRLEVTANDAPYFQVSNVPAVVQVASVALTMPLLSAAQAAALPVDTATLRSNAAPRTRAAALPATGRAAPVGWLALAAILLAICVRRRVRRAW